MDQYNFVIARVREIVERQRREEIEDNDIQSDELASSIFDGIGMEMDIDNTGEGTGDGDLGRVLRVVSLLNVTLYPDCPSPGKLEVLFKCC
jgi:hypothetical protein